MSKYIFNEDVYIFRAWEFIAMAFLMIGIIEFYLESSWIIWMGFVTFAIVVYIAIPSFRSDKTTTNKTKQRGRK